MIPNESGERYAVAVFCSNAEHPSAVIIPLFYFRASESVVEVDRHRVRFLNENKRIGFEVDVKIKYRVLVGRVYVSVIDRMIPGVRVRDDHVFLDMAVINVSARRVAQRNQQNHRYKIPIPDFHLLLSLLCFSSSRFSLSSFNHKYNEHSPTDVKAAAIAQSVSIKLLSPRPLLRFYRRPVYSDRQTMRGTWSYN